MKLQPSAFVYMALNRIKTVLLLCAMVGGTVAVFQSQTTYVPPNHHDNPLPLIITVAVLAVLSFPVVLLYTLFLAQSYRIELGKDGIHLKYGVLSITTELMPYGKMQDIVISQDILGRLMSLVTIKIQNAMGKPITIVGCSQADAEMLRDAAIARAKAA
jgi:membrane protein YdbS with pleckstrin-like domain